MSSIPIDYPEDLVNDKYEDFVVVEKIELGTEPFEQLKVMLCVVHDGKDNYYGLSYLANEGNQPVRYSNTLREIELKNGMWQTKEKSR